MWWLKSLLVGALGGFLGGMFGVGGGIIMVPLLMYLMGMPIHDAKATSLAIILVVGVGGTIQHQRRGQMTIDWPCVIVAGLTAAFAAAYGATLSEKVKDSALQRMFAGLIILVALRMLITGKPKAPAPHETPVAPVTESVGQG